MKSFRYLPLFVFAILAVFSLGYIVTKTISNPLGSIDLHAYWYAGHFLRQGTDPYTAYINNQVLKTPITYLDGHVTQNSPVAQPGLALVPACTAPMVELITFFSFFSWPTAKVLWMVCNLVLILAIPFWILRLFPLLNKRPLTDKLLFGLIFIALFGTRNTAGNGQTSLLVFAAMLLALLADERHWFSAGIALGFALSKYSLALPVLILFLLESKYRQIIVGFIIQAVAVLAISVISRQPILSILAAYVQIFRLYSNQAAGIQLATLFPAGNLAGWVAVVILTLVTAVFLGHWLYSRKMRSLSASNPLVREIVFCVLMLWTLLVAYHRNYDTLVTILFIAVIAEFLIQTGGLHPWQSWLLAAMAGLTIIIMTSPARGLMIIERQTSTGFMAIWLNLQHDSVTILLVAILACSIWILYQYKPTKEHRENPKNEPTCASS